MRDGVIIIRCCFNLNRQVFHETKVKGFDASLYETVQVFFDSKDGTKIPMFIVHSKVRKMSLAIFPAA